ncbi:EAL domain-containing protein [Lacimicrobium sp. SS2-24]|uniref:EAL domain-containing response regulator n=1 Tax=Lacimicrobium sp. SS2-24 TaxID=2005569 RepID=UPI000B4A8C23|nr:EAL domain-containing protein [Lacimicrobium sp. SS2-24]
MSHIVIIEDVTEIGLNLCEFAEHAGFSSRFFSRFDEATLSDLQDASHIILDLNMPGHDGLDVLEVLSKERIHVPIILCSGVAEDIIDSAVDVLQESGLVFGGKLPKPFSYEQFKDLVTGVALPALSEKSRITPRKQINLTRGDLAIAIRRNWFYPVFQPQIDVETNTVFGVECLARLNHPLFGQCGPDAFISKLVQTELIDTFTEHFIAESLCRLAKIGFPPQMRVSFNIDPNSLRKNFLANLAAHVSDHYIKASQICLEITELSAVAMSKELKSILTKLRVHGFHISLDDFGTGFSTVHELDLLPFNELKIDRSFVSHLTERSGTLTIIKHTLGLAADMKLLVIAEGVETSEQVEHLKALGCKYMQGFYYSKPLELSALESFLVNYPQQPTPAGSGVENRHD